MGGIGEFFKEHIVPSIPLVGSIYSAIRSDKNQKQSNALSQQALDLQRQQWEQYGKPMADISLGQTYARSPIWNYMLGIQQNMLGMPSPAKAGGGSGGGLFGNVAKQIISLMGDGGPSAKGSTVQNQEVPWFMQSPQPGGSEYNQLQNSMNNLGRLGRTAAANQQSNSLADFYASRGTPMSSNQASNLPGFNRWYATEVGREKSNSALAMFDIAQQMRQQGQNNFYNLNNLLQGGQVQSQPTAWASTFGQTANSAQNQAMQYGQQAGKSIGILGYQIGQMLAQRQQQLQSQPLNNYGSFAPPLNNSGILWDQNLRVPLTLGMGGGY